MRKENARDRNWRAPVPSISILVLDFQGIIRVPANRGIFGTMDLKFLWRFLCGLRVYTLFSFPADRKFHLDSEENPNGLARW